MAVAHSSSIAMQAFSLGFALALCTIATVFLVKEGRPIWRLPAFFACLSTFHFLEFWTTAKFNMPAARASSFLLRNGTAYTFAHGLATTEIVVSTFLPSYQSRLVNPFSMALGAVLVILGQLLRSAAMARGRDQLQPHTCEDQERGTCAGDYGRICLASTPKLLWRSSGGH